MAVVKTLIGNIKGPKGEKGDKGDTGAKGDKGATGQRGSRWTQGTAITGTSTTATIFSNSGISDALVNDNYLNTSTGNTYRCTVSGNASTAKWVYSGNIKGVKGDTGAKGEKGDTGATGPKGPQGEYAAVDSVLSKTSTNPIQNKAAAEEFEKKLNSDGDSKDLTATFTSNDSTNVTEWTDVELLTSGEKHSSMFQKISTMFKNIRYLYHMLGTADISTLGEGADIGTVTGALSKLNSDNTYGRKVYNSGTLLDIFEQELDNMNKHTDWGFIVTNEVSDLKNYFPELYGWHIFVIKTQANESICTVYDSWEIRRSYKFVYVRNSHEIVQLYYDN